MFQINYKIDKISMTHYTANKRQTITQKLRLKDKLLYYNQT